MRQQGVNVSDHALMRWLERFAGVELTEYRKQIGVLVKDAMDAGATSVTIDGYIYQLDPRSRTVITICIKNTKKGA